MIDPAARARLEWWKQSLLDLSIDNPLIDARESRTCIVLATDPIKLATALDGGGGLAIVSGRNLTDANQLWTALEPDVLAKRLVAIRREARRARTDRGTHILWMAVGMLAWKQDDRTHHAPLALWPVELDVAGDSIRVVSAVEPGWLEPKFNGALAEKLRLDFDLIFAPTLDTLSGAGDRLSALATLLEAAEGIALTRPGWHVERGARLGCFLAGRHAQWEDLERRGDDVFTSPVVTQLASGAGLGFAQPSSIAAAAVTQRLVFQSGASELASELLAPLDADAAQLQAVAAAGVGASFVLQAPPGTGASQTIANLIVHCVGRGKTVLFVSDKLSALNDVQQRLSAVGLGDLCLTFASRDRAIDQLDRVLTRAFRPASGPALLDGNRLGELCNVLDGHAASLHRVGAFGRSLHEALGRLVELRTTPRAALADADAVGLNAATFEQRRTAVEQLASAAVRVEPVASHPWRTSTLARSVFGAYPEGRERALTAIDDAAAAAAALRAALRDLVSLVPGVVARTREQLQALGALAAIAAGSPRPGAELLTPLTTSRKSAQQNDTGALDEQIALIRARGSANSMLETPRDPLAFLVLAKRHRVLAKEVDDRFTDAVERIDAAALWSQLRKWTNSVAPLRFVALRTARAEVKAVAQPLQLETDAAMIAALEAVIAERACRVALEAAAEPARRWFGELGGKPLELDLEKIEGAVTWGAQLRRAFDAVDVINGEPGRDTAWRSLVAQVAAGPDGLESPHDASIGVLGRLAEAVVRWLPALSELTAATGVELVDDSPKDNDHLAMLAERTATLRHAIDDLADWVTFYEARHNALACGVGPAVAAIDRGDLVANELALAWERATILAWVDAELVDSQVAVMGGAHHAHVAAFADLDRAALALVRSRALVRFAERVPALPLGKLDPDTEVGVATAALRKPAGLSLRALFAKIPTVLPRIAPCLAMTPEALTQHLDPGIRFDVVVLDEASQLPTAEAIGALSRGAAAVIVGDSQLLRPTRALADGTTVPVDGVLADCLAARIPELRLAWHYRSRHHDLVAYANERFYDDRLHVFPATQGSPDLGIAVRRGPLDAETIVADVLARLRDPSQRGRSLAVIAGSAALAERIEDLLDSSRAADRALDAAFAGDVPVVVATVDQAQGITRDVIVLAADAPLGDRLAVAISRACEQLVIFADDVVDPELAQLLARGERIVVEELPASPITAAIARALVERGWSLRHQIGCGAYKIDLAVVDPSDPERYVLAIEHDGSAYATAPAARDRDRLRSEALTQLGWRVHRIWSIDWWSDPEREIQRAHGAIVTAIAAARQRRAPAAAPRPTPAVARSRSISERPRAAVSIPPLRADKTTPTSIPVEAFDPATIPTLAAGSAPVRLPKNAIPIGPYIAAAIPPGRRTPDDLFAPRHLAELGKVVEQVLAAEAPMHLDLLARRVGAYFGIGRVTQRVTEQVRTVLLGRGRLGEEKDIVWRLDQDPAAIPPVRVAGSGPGSPTGKRDIGEIPLSELASAARIVVERAAGIATTDLVRDAARLIGFARITPEVSERVTQAVRFAQIRQLIAIDNGRARLPE